MGIDWNRELIDQLESHWRLRLRPRLDGLTDDEYFWEPVADCWSIRRRGASSAPTSFGAGEFTIDYGEPPHDPEPVTTIAWRLAHVILTFAHTAGGWMVCAASAGPAWPGRRARRSHQSSPMRRWPSSSCTSTWRSSTTVPRSA